jgi:uncharacterized RDD family membrane protein YckC
MNWFYSSNNQQQGPVSQETLASLVATGTVQADSLIWRDGLPSWQPARQALPELFAGLPPIANKDLYVQQLREGVNPMSRSLTLASWGARFGAKLLDNIIVFICIALLAGVYFGILFAAGLLETDSKDPPALAILGVLIFYGLALLGPIIYNAVSVAKSGTTIGKKVVGIRVVNADGSPVSTGKSWGRAFATLINDLVCALLYLMPLFDEQKRALHDMICDTRVVEN